MKVITKAHGACDWCDKPAVALISRGRYDDGDEICDSVCADHWLLSSAVTDLSGKSAENKI